MYAVTLVMEDGSEKKISCAADTYVLDQAEADGIDMRARSQTTTLQQRLANHRCS